MFCDYNFAKEGENMSELFQQMFSDTNIHVALLHLSKKKDTFGLDGIYLSQLETHWTKYGSEIVAQLQKSTYEPEIVEEFEILSRKGKKRNINKMSSVDRLLTRAITQLLQEKYN